MTISQSDLLEFLDAIRAGGDTDAIRQGAEFLYQALIEAEATEAIGAARYERSEERVTQRNGHRPGRCRPRPVTSSCKIPKLRRGTSSPRCSSAAGGSTGPCSPWSWRPTCTASPPARSTTSWRPWASTSGISKSEVSRICRRAGRPSWRPSGPGACRHVEFPYVFLDATYLKGRVEPPGGVPRRCGGHGGDHGRQP